MGQQQLLLLVLGVVIVGLAVVVGIQAFSENQLKANADAMVNDGVRIASDVQAWALKPEAFGGAGGWDTQGNVTPIEVDFNSIGYSAPSGTYSNLNADYTVSTTDCGAAVPSGGTPVIYISGTSDQGNNICVAVGGTNPEDIGTEVTISTS